MTSTQSFWKIIFDVIRKFNKTVSEQKLDYTLVFALFLSPYLVNLTTLNLESNKNSKIDIFIKLVQLDSLSLYSNSVSDLRPLSTSTVSAQGARTYSGALPFQGACAVHLWKAGDPGSGPAEFPFGATAVLSQSVPMYPGNTSHSVFTVLNTGDYNIVHTPHFIDVWQATDYIGGTIWC